MRVHLIDGTYELFRFFYGVPSQTTEGGQEVGASRGVVGSLLGLLEAGATHVAVATDHVIESFRNDLWPGYKDGSGIDPDLLSQFGLLEEALDAAGFTVWPMVEHEADDGLGAGAAMAAADLRVEQVLICTPDKDLAQCVEGTRVVQFDRRQRRLVDEDGVRDKFGVSPASIPDYLALVGDSADGFRVCPAGEPNRHRRFWRATGISRRSLRRPRSGTSRCAARRGWQERYGTGSSSRSCFDTSRRSTAARR